MAKCFRHPVPGSTKPEEEALCWQRGRERLTGVEMDGISWKGLKSETIQLTLAQNK